MFAACDIMTSTFLWFLLCARSSRVKPSRMITCTADHCPTHQDQMDVSKMCSPAGLKPQADENKPLMFIINMDDKAIEMRILTNIIDDRDKAG